ncbi:HD domain protein, nadD domain, nicotinate-nucleotide adenylyltransferase [Candidatus Mycoplasma haematolamae str. Purdue]|uniref:bis(5'-nucleosyl)-tetraphosphatase (symmetrical) n=1 Tax=Mycoplasma haematolamae (strain Purdue) TaxID=1212765 RepID=I7CH39_MYCHA|nr:bis(5'-nucleosyl)-tetraphosphatase (symmetrical) YqeK [Candidatus Mycoplasma haematolamae]AFO52481.1 HD domain protein, nadD domain, nicotinate-nucleotide adenylyltransferase [Candidatus Mycoplasma haematolamae str. Purdue]
MVLFCKSTRKISIYSRGKKKYLEVDRANRKANSLYKALERVERETTPSRFEHTLRVIQTAAEISRQSKLREEEHANLLLACAYHDFSKNWSRARLLNKASILYSKSKEELLPSLWWLHGPIGANYLKEKGYVSNPSILRAIEYHSRPIKDLDRLGKILIIADKIEPNKKHKFSEEQYSWIEAELERGNVDSVYSYFLELPPKGQTT